MGKGRSKNKVKRSTATLPKGIPHKRGGGSGGGGPSPFEFASRTNNASRVKHHVHNRLTPGQQQQQKQQQNNNIHQSSLAKSISRRKSHLSALIAREGKANKFIDRRIGEATQTNNYDGPSKNDVMLKRIVQERVRRSKKYNKFNLNDDDDDNDGGGVDNGLQLTHRGKTIDESYNASALTHEDVLLSDSDDDDLDKVDTMLHFGGGNFDADNNAERGAYGPSSGGGGGGSDMGEVHRSRKEELEERIRHKKLLKAERMKQKEDQVGTFETMDESFSELATLLQFRDKEEERRQKFDRKRDGKLSQDEKEMDAWDKEMKVCGSIIDSSFMYCMSFCYFSYSGTPCANIISSSLIYTYIIGIPIRT